MHRALPRTALALSAAATAVTALTGCAPSGTGFAAAADRHAVVSTHGQTPIVAWYRQTGPKISAVEQSITYAQWMVRRPEHRGLAAACTHILTGVAAVQADPVAPDAIARAAIDREMTWFERAAKECLRGDLDAAGKSVDAGHRHAEVAGRRVVALLHAAS